MLEGRDHFWRVRRVAAAAQSVEIARTVSPIAYRIARCAKGDDFKL
jgi:hypothetical protein